MEAFPPTSQVSDGNQNKSPRLRRLFPIRNSGERSLDLALSDV
jgi:hypothetical protein